MSDPARIGRVFIVAGGTTELLHAVEGLPLRAGSIIYRGAANPTL